MSQDLEWLARNVQEWGGKESFPLIARCEGGHDYFMKPQRAGEFSRQDWHQARQDLGLIMTEEEEEMGNDSGCNERWSKWHDWDKSPQMPRSVATSTEVQIINTDEEVKPYGDSKLYGDDIEWKEVTHYRFKLSAPHGSTDCNGETKKPTAQKVSRSDGSTASYYELPAGCTELQHLISHRNLNAQDGEIFRAIYRKGMASHSDELRDAKKVLFYAQAEVNRLEALK